jgi:hypothetical protein
MSPGDPTTAPSVDGLLPEDSSIPNDPGSFSPGTVYSLTGGDMGGTMGET